jgi:hypothetical protein
MSRITTIAALVVFTLSACGESDDEIYERGFNDGVDAVCYRAQNVGDNFYQKLKSAGGC